MKRFILAFLFSLTFTGFFYASIWMSENSLSDKFFKTGVLFIFQFIGFIISYFWIDL